MPKGGFNTRAANVILPSVTESVHALVNQHRAYYGLPEWDFNSKPNQQWWKSIPAVNAKVNEMVIIYLTDLEAKCKLTKR